MNPSNKLQKSHFGVFLTAVTAAAVSKLLAIAILNQFVAPDSSFLYETTRSLIGFFSFMGALVGVAYALRKHL
jgi:undecaprenyl pyrophosphate phosphatase UppP